MAAARSLSAFVLAVLSVGCAGPTTTVRHELPADLPVPSQASVVRFDRFEGEGDLSSIVEKALRERLAGGCGRRRLAAEGEPAKLVIGGRVDAETNERGGVRAMSDGRPALSKAAGQSGTVPTLVRTASMKVIFNVADAAGRQIASAEAREHYVSSDDPRARGELALGRPDDPKNVPTFETILAEQAARAAARFCRMIEPPVVEAQVQLRPAGPGKALDAAERGDWPAAYAAFADAVARNPRSADLQFNLAVAEEATGRLAEAVARYADLSARRDKLGEQAATCRRRAERVLQRTALPPDRAGGKQRQAG